MARSTGDAGRHSVTRRGLLVAAASAALFPVRPAYARDALSFGLTPVFLDSDVELLAQLQTYLERRTGRPVELVKRRTYQEITALLISGQLDAAWICGFPFVQFEDRLSLLAVPVYRGQPLYQSYIIVHAGDPAARFEDLRGSSHAFSDPDSNSGFLVTRHLLAVAHETPDSFFSNFFFTYGHRDVIRAVASGLARSGSVDGYVWDVVGEVEPKLVAGTRVIRRSEFLGFPPIACARAAVDGERAQALRQALLDITTDPAGRQVLAMLHLDGFTAASPKLFDTIADKYRFVEAQL